MELAAIRESKEKLGYTPKSVKHIGDCYIVARTNGSGKAPAIQSRTLAHISRFETDGIKAGETLQWTKPLKLGTLKLAPAVEQIVARAFFGDDFFFEEFNA